MNVKLPVALAFALATVAATPAFAADAAPAASAAIGAAAQALNLPSVTVPGTRSRAEVRAEAVDFVANYKTMLQTQLELANN